MCSRAIAIALCLAPMAAQGEVRIEGTAAAIRITTDRDSIGAVLAALRPAFDVQHRSATALDQPASRTYAGPIDRVIASLLADYNYVVKRSQGHTEIVVLGRHGEAFVLPPKAAQPTGMLSRWR